jgi:hypothetical protein
MADWFDQNAPPPAAIASPEAAPSADWFDRHAPQPNGPSPFLRGALRTLPAIGGLTGGVVGGTGGSFLAPGPGTVGGAVAGAALGGAGGKALENVIEALAGIRPQPTLAGIPADYLGQAQAGNVQGLSEVAGIGLGKVAGSAARGLTRLAVRPSPTLFKKFPGLVKTIADEGIPLDAGKAATARSAAAADAGKVYQAATDAGHTLTIADIARPALDQAAKRNGGALAPAEQAAIIARFHTRANELFAGTAKGIIKEKGTFTPVEAKALKQAAQDAARGDYGAATGGRNIGANPDLDLEIATGTKRALEAIPSFGPKIAKAEARTQTLIGVAKAMLDAEAKQQPNWIRFGLPGAAAAGAAVAPDALAGRAEHAGLAWLASKALTTPRMLSLEARLLSNPAVRAAIRQAPRTAGAGLSFLSPPPEPSVPAPSLFWRPNMVGQLAPPDTLIGANQ